MRDERLNVVFAFLAFSVVLLWTVLPTDGMIKPFPLSGQEIHFQTYIWIASIYAAFIILTLVMYRYSDRARDFFNAAFILQALQFVEYFINYNEAWTHIHEVPVNIGTLRFPILFFYAIRTFTTWRT